MAAPFSPSTTPTLAINVGDSIDLGVRMNFNGPVVISAVSGPNVDANGNNTYAVTVPQGVYTVSAASTVLSAKNSAGVALWVVGK